MLSVATINVMIALLEAAPTLIAEVKKDIADFTNNALTDADLQSRWTLMVTTWNRAKAEWAAAAQPAA